ncbi:MAG TPA: hypothetical protein VMU19_01435 [Bryobacteraceae bacterium]|nr:hypothetical protein [Bryobacteraceae bacterium]
MLLLPLLAWFWGAADALLFVACSAAAASPYLSMEFRLIDGVPFTQPPDPAQGARQMIVTLVGIFVVLAALAVQYFVIFRSRMLAAAAALAIGIGAWMATRIALRSVERQMRYRLGLLRDEAGRIYKEVA